MIVDFIDLKKARYKRAVRELIATESKAVKLREEIKRLHMEISLRQHNKKPEQSA